jgi:Fe2+ transport system protein B
MDALDDPSSLARLEAHVARLGLPVYRISGATGQGVDALLEAIWRQIAAERERPAAEAARPVETDQSVDLISPARVRRDR